MSGWDGWQAMRTTACKHSSFQPLYPCQNKFQLLHLKYHLQACSLGSYIEYSIIFKRGWRPTSGCIHRARCVQELVSHILRVMSTDAVATSGEFLMKATASTDSVCPSADDLCKVGQGSASSINVSLLHCLEGVSDCLFEHQARAKLAQDLGGRG